MLASVYLKDSVKVLKVLHQRHKKINDVLWKVVASPYENDSGLYVAFWAFLRSTARRILVLGQQTGLTGNMGAGRQIEINGILGILAQWMI